MLINFLSIQVLNFYLTPYSVVGLEGFYKNSFNKDEVGYFGGNLVFKLVF